MTEFLARKRQVFCEGAYSLASIATANPSWTRFGATNKAIYCSKKSCRFLNRLRFFNLSMSLFACSKFASNLLTHNRRGIFNRERRRNIKIFQAFIGWKAPSIMRYRRVQLGLGVASLTGIEPICLGTINPQAFIRPLAWKFFNCLRQSSKKSFADLFARRCMTVLNKQIGWWARRKSAGN